MTDSEVFVVLRPLTRRLNQEAQRLHLVGHFVTIPGVIVQVSYTCEDERYGRSFSADTWESPSVTLRDFAGEALGPLGKEAVCQVMTNDAHYFECACMHAYVEYYKSLEVFTAGARYDAWRRFVAIPYQWEEEQ